MANKAYELEHGVLSRVADDEPIFVFRAKDPRTIAIMEVYNSILVASEAPREKIISVDASIRSVKAWRKKEKLDQGGL